MTAPLLDRVMAQLPDGIFTLRDRVAQVIEIVRREQRPVVDPDDQRHELLPMADVERE